MVEPSVREPSYVAAVALEEIAPGSQKVWQHGLQRVLLCRSREGHVYAMLDLCPHARQPIGGGGFDDTSITCPKHGACFDIRSGMPLNGVTARPLRTLPVRIRGGGIEVGF